MRIKSFREFVNEPIAEEQLDELEAKTLRSYTKKAEKSLVDIDRKSETHYEKAKTDRNSHHEYMKLQHKYKKRAQFHHKAAMKLIPSVVKEEEEIEEGASIASDPVKYVTVNKRSTKGTAVIQKHNQREKSMYHTTRTGQVLNVGFKSKSKSNSSHLTNKKGEQLTDRWNQERRRHVASIRSHKNIGESEEYLANRKLIHDAHAESSRQLAGKERDPELRRIDLHRSKKHEHASRVIDRLLLNAKKKKDAKD